MGRSSVTLLIEVLGHPRIQVGAVAPDLGHALFRLRGRDPRFRGPTPPVDQALVAKEIGARVILRIRRWHALELLPLDVVSLLAKGGHDPRELVPRAIVGDGP